MQTDFHFYAVYALARAAGFDPGDSHTVAYASEHTDDAKYAHTLDFENGGRFKQVLTAHRFLHWRVLDDATCYRIWLPFHFLPGNQGADFYERMVTRAGGSIAKRLMDDLLSSHHKPYFLHRLGIFLHCYADTWSHQNFLGVKQESMNRVRRVKIKGLSRSEFLAHLRWLKKRVLEYAAPGLGHAQAGSIPDEPYREWRYQNHAGKIFDITNSKRSLDAAQGCYEVMTRFLYVFPGYSRRSPRPWHEFAKSFENLFRHDGDLKERIQAWKNAISGGLFGWDPREEDQNLNYHDRDWFNAAVAVKERADRKELYERKPGFETSHWKYFHDAAAYHQFTVLHEVLPEQGMICG